MKIVSTLEGHIKRAGQGDHAKSKRSGWTTLPSGYMLRSRDKLGSDNLMKIRDCAEVSYTCGCLWWFNDTVGLPDSCPFDPNDLESGW